MRLENKQREAYLGYIKERLDEKRIRHTLGVEKMALAMAERFGADEAAAQTAALLHDAAKKIKKQEKRDLAQIYNIRTDDITMVQPDLLHGPLAAKMVKQQLGIADEDILNAICYHTTGRAGMSKLEKIIYLADLIEEGRSFPGVEQLRALAEEDLDKALLAGMRHVLLYVIGRGELVHPDSVIAYNHLIQQKGEREV
ncbi:MAG: bis(5'-nucleosyl)-tetraphosphatase (symmetrical) YqeK [Christensenellaceae bacterium]|nr:bis(5'-nucleosyl)-tetraphosphatase (symmetrical) YqeK [Christensenellaceae bacterium]